MSVPGNYFVTEEFFSAARFNRKTVTHLPGSGTDSISTLSPTYPNQIVVCTATGGGFTVDTMYIRNTANTAWIGGSGGIHDHSAQADAQGGLFSNVVYANLMKVIWHNITSPTLGQFQVEVNSGGATSSDVTPQVRLATGATNGAFTHISRGGIGLSYGSKQRFIARMTCSHNTFLTARLGVYTERVDAAGDNTAKYGLEACDSAGTARNWDIFSADGTTRTAITTSAINVQQATQTAYRLDFTTATNIQLFVNNSLAGGGTKSNNVPGNVSVSAGRTIGIGLKTNNTTAKTIDLTGMAFTGVPSTSGWS